MRASDSVGPVGQPARQLGRRLHQLGILDHVPDQAPFLGLLGRDLRRQHGERPRPLLADQARQEPGAAAVGQQADAGEGLQERRRLGGDGDVGGEREAHADARRHAVHRRHDRLGQRAHEADHRIEELLERGARIGVALASRSGSARSAPAQKPRPAPVSSTARTEASAARSSQHELDLGDHLARHGVQLVRRVQGERRQAVVLGEQDLARRSSSQRPVKLAGRLARKAATPFLVVGAAGPARAGCRARGRAAGRACWWRPR